MNFLQKTFAIFAGGIFNHKFKVLSACIGITLFLSVPALRIKLDSDLTALLSEQHPVVVNLRKIAKYYGGEGYLVLLVRSPSAPAGENFIGEILPDLQKHPFVRFVDYKKPTEFIEKNMMMFIDTPDLEKIYARLKKKLDYEREEKGAANSLLGLNEKSDPGFNLDDIADKYRKKYNISEANEKATADIYFHKKEIIAGKEAHSYVLLVKPSQSATDVAYSKQLIAEMRTVIERHRPEAKNIQVQFTGRYQKKIDLIEQLAADFQLVSAISALGILLILIVFYRSFWPVFLVFLTLLVGLLWTLGATQLVFRELNLVTSYLVAILTGLGIDFGIHFMTRFHEEIDAGKNVETGIKNMIAQTGLSSAISGLTTAFAFFALVLSDFRAFVEFGIIAGIGITLILAAMTFLLGALMSIVYQKFPVHFSKIRNPLSLPPGIFKRPGLILVVASGIALVSLAGIRNLKFDYNFEKLFSYPDIESFNLDIEANKMFSATLTPSIVIAESVAEEMKIVAAVKAHIGNGAPDNLIENVLALSSFIPENQEQKLAVIAKLRDLTDRFAKYVPELKPKYRENYRRFQKALKTGKITPADLPAVITNNFQGLNSYKDKRIILVYPKPAFDAGDNPIRFGRQVNSIRIDGKPIAMASDTLVFSEILNVITTGGYKILLFSVLGVFFLIWLNLLSVKRSLLVMIPLILSMIWLPGIMGILNLPVDFFNVIIFPIIVGIGIDSSVHIYNRSIEEGDMMKSVMLTGEAVTLSSLTTLIGFGALAVARSAGVRSIGYVAIIGVFTAYVAAIFIMPALVLYLDQRRRKNS